VGGGGGHLITTACAVSISGIIGWVGLVIPHVARMIYGPDYRRLIPASLSLGGCYLLLIDDLARNLSGQRGTAGHSHRLHRGAGIRPGIEKEFFGMGRMIRAARSGVSNMPAVQQMGVSKCQP
jgi:hypothetical protein